MERGVLTRTGLGTLSPGAKKGNSKVALIWSPCSAVRVRRRPWRPMLRIAAGELDEAAVAAWLARDFARRRDVKTTSLLRLLLQSSGRGRNGRSGAEPATL